ncbi:hypothetical protein BS78_01G475600 [Paspalum vaginatum]|nr:hypothetical protein BS78_01G475600 [Paspalum vaginatum]
MEEEGGRHAQAQRRRRPRSPASSSLSLLSPPPPPHDYLAQPALPPGQYEPVEEEEAPPPSKRACIAASNESMLGLQQVMPTAGDADDCAICLTSLLLHPSSSEDPEDKIVRAMPCSHAFHQRCIFQWLSRNAVCPLCRHELPTAHPTMTIHERTFHTLDDEDRYIASLGDAIIHLQDDTEEEEVDEEMESRRRGSERPGLSSNVGYPQLHPPLLLIVELAFRCLLNE